jgi:hypothetical protein
MIASNPINRGNDHDEEHAMNAPVVPETLKTVRIPDKAIIGDGPADAASGKTFDCVSPIDGTVLARIPACDSEDVDCAVKFARAAFEGGAWSMAAPRKRKAILKNFVKVLRDHAEELAMLETLDVGKPISNSRSVDIPGSISCIEWYAEAVDKIYDELAPTGPGAVAMVTRDPDRRTGARSGLPERCVPSAARFRRDGRSGTRSAHGRRHDCVHRLVRSRQILPEVRR